MLKVKTWEVEEGENEITSIFFSSASMFAFFVFSHERIADIFLEALSQDSS